jgi:hypothetical protein
MREGCKRYLVRYGYDDEQDRSEQFREFSHALNFYEQIQKSADRGTFFNGDWIVDEFPNRLARSAFCDSKILH